MKNNGLRIVVYLMLCLGVAAPLNAELYKWTDENGKIHYSDRKPATQTNAREISRELTPINIDDSGAQRQALGNVFPKASESRQRLDDKQRKRQDSRSEACENARNYLRKINRRVRFVDKDGEPVKVSEAERKARVVKLQAQIKKNCR